jgi:hypothetical protein
MEAIRILPIFLILVLTAIPLISAGDAFLLCLEDGQELELSKCNPAINDYECNDTKCQICVTQKSDGTYCQASPNACNAAGGQCIPLTQYESEDPVITLISPDNFHEESPGGLRFEFELTYSSEVNSCELIINGESVDSTTSLSSENELINNFEEASYLWKISCETNTIDTIESETRVLYILNQSNDDPPVDPPNDTPPEDNSTNNDNNSNSNSNSNNNKPKINTQSKNFEDPNKEDIATQKESPISLGIGNTSSLSGSWGIDTTLLLAILSLMSIINTVILLFLHKTYPVKTTKNKKISKKK